MIYFIALLIQNTYMLSMLKILTHKPHIKTQDCLLVLIIGAGGGVLFPYIGIFISPIMVACLCYHTYKVSKYNFKKSLFLSTLTMLIAILWDHVASIFLSLIFDETSFENYNLLFIHLIIASLLAIIFTIIFTKLTKKIRLKINQNEQIQFVLASTTTLALALFYGNIIFAQQLGNNIDIIQLNLIVLIVYLIVGVIIFYFYSKKLHDQYEIQRKKDEQNNLIKYTEEIEAQYKKMRKFKHDYQNILSSLDDFIASKDYDGLTNYYSNKIKPASAVLAKHRFALEPLSKIKISEIKSILSFKLMNAQELGLDVKFEADDDIEEIVVDSLILVRTLGILLDNAIEALIELKTGSLEVAVFKQDGVVTFIIENSCRQDLPPFHQLKQSGFSTKGVDRGLGLSNLAEFMDQHPDMLIDTVIDADKQKFTQKIIIGG